MYAAAILTVFISQELLEGAFAAGHAAGLAGVFGGGGWLAVPLALLAGALAALIDRGVFAAEELMAAVALRQRVRPERAAAAAPHAAGPDLVPLASAPLAFGIARRPPPALR